MSNLIRAELFKLQRNKTFWVLIGTVAGLSALLHYLVIIDWWQMSRTAFESAGLSELNALATFTVPLFFNLIVSTLAGFYVSTEFSQGSVIKNQMISGNKRAHIYMAKYLLFSLGSIIVTILIPLITAIIVVILNGQGDIFHLSNVMYLGRAYGLFTLQFLGFTAILLIIAIMTEDSGKTIILSILFTIGLFAIEKLGKAPIIESIYEYTIFFQFSDVFKASMTNGDILKSMLIGVISWIFITIYGIFIFNKKEIK